MAKDRWYIRHVGEETQIKLNTIATNSKTNVGDVVTKLANMINDYALRNGISHAQALAQIIQIVEKTDPALAEIAQTVEEMEANHE